MALGIDDIVEDLAIPVVLAGVGVVLVAPFLLAGSRPLAKKAVAAYLSVSDKVKESAAETKEKWADLVAEVRAERAVAVAGAAEVAAEAQPEAAPVA